jgi:hypothetical protein
LALQIIRSQILGLPGPLTLAIFIWWQTKNKKDGGENPRLTKKRSGFSRWLASFWPYYWWPDCCSL